ncbi:MAG: hypothetical protein KDA45_09960, partial [Planctomycetales bacterium]|nr:hypothetical protein [Planctomycetales bacterium]
MSAIYRRGRGRRLCKILCFTAAIMVGMLMVLRTIENSILYPAPPKSDGDWQASWLEREEV